MEQKIKRLELEVTADAFQRIPKEIRKNQDAEGWVKVHYISAYQHQKEVAALQRKISALKAENEELKVKLARRS